jgi:DNA-binding transcriptional LysR family regulator
MVAVTVQQLWLPALTHLLETGEIDVGITCGITLARPGVRHAIFCGEQLLVAVRPSHRLASATSISLGDLAGDTLGLTRDSLFPAWALSQRQAVAKAGIEPPSLELDDIDIGAHRWQEQSDVDWIMLIGSFAAGHDPATIKPTEPAMSVPFVLQWAPERASSAAVVNFVDMALSIDPPPTWSTGPAHERNRQAD